MDRESTPVPNGRSAAGIEGGMATRVGTFNWAGTSLGPIDRWPGSLRTAVDICLSGAVPMFVWWGLDLVNIYNDAYAPVLGKRHPDALGRPARQIWADIWPDIGADVEAVVRDGRAVVRERVRLVMDRNGYSEETYFTFSHSPIRDESGKIAGLFQICTDETARVRSETDARSILESITDSFIALDREWRFNYVNRQAESLLGKTPGGLVGQIIWEAFPGLIGSGFEKVYRRVVAAGAAESITAFYPDHDRWYEVHVYPAPAGGISIYFRNVTDRVRGDQELTETNALLRGLSDTTGDVIYAKDRQGRLRLANPAALALIGKPLDQVIGRTDAEFLGDPVAARSVMETDQRIMSTGTAADVEEIVPLPDGTHRVWLSRKMPNVDNDGKIVGLLGVSRDITESKTASDRVRKLYEVTAALSEAVSPADVARVTVREGISSIGATAGSLSTISEDGTHLLTIGSIGFPPEMVAKWHRFSVDAGIPLAEAVRTSAPVFIESPAERIARFPALAEINPWTETRSSASIPLVAGGRCLGVLGLSFSRPQPFSPADREFIDSVCRQCAQSMERARLFEVEQRARARAERAEGESRELIEKLERQTRLFERIASSTPDFIYVFDRNARFVYANRRLLEVWGTTFEQAVGKGLLELGYPQWHADMHHRELQQVIETKQPVIGEVPFTGGSGISGVYEYIFTPVPGPDGEVDVIAGTTRDITERKQIEAQRERTMAAEREAREQAERASRMKDEFLATLSHELRTPLNAILGWATILSSSHPTPEDLRDGLETIQRNARAQTQIIEDLLDMSRIISGKIRMDVQRMNPSAAIQAAVDTVRPAADARGVRIRTVLDPQAGPVSGDPNRLQQVFWNLLTNSVKFTPRGGQVQVVLSRVNSHVEVTVADTGEGISAEFLPFVFDRFRQADASSTRRHGGLGLGLSIVKQLVELHGGSIRVASQGLGQGTTFTVAIPLLVAHVDERDSPLTRRHPVATADSPEGPAEIPQLRGLKVVIVDDEPDARAIVKRLLEDRGASVRSAASAEEAVAMISAEVPGILISDIGMPVEDGFALIRRVRALPPAAGGDVPAIALTAYARTEDRIRAVRSGFQTHVAKPVEPLELITLVASLAGRTV